MRVTSTFISNDRLVRAERSLLRVFLLASDKLAYCSSASSWFSTSRCSYCGFDSCRKGTCLFSYLPCFPQTLVPRTGPRHSLASFRQRLRLPFFILLPLPWVPCIVGKTALDRLYDPRSHVGSILTC